MAFARKRAQEQLRPRTPEPVEGRKHVDVQTGMWAHGLVAPQSVWFSESVHFV